MVEGQKEGVTICHRRRGSGATVDQRDLAEELAWSETSESLIIALDDDVAGSDDEELMSGLALAHQHVAIGRLDFARKIRKPLDL
jgi:hypothetical protein